MKDLTSGNLEKALLYAKEIGDNSLQECIDRLTKTEENWENQIEVTILNDFAPLSFYFVKHYVKDNHFISNGGIIFHGPHDRGGDGGAPTFSISTTPTTGWSIHT